MNLGKIEATYICQLGKSANRNRLVMFAADKSSENKGQKLADFIRFLYDVLQGTPAWGKPGTNKMLNDIFASARATMTNAKKGKKSAYRLAGDLLRSVDYNFSRPGYLHNPGHCSLVGEFTETELLQLAQI